MLRCLTVALFALSLSACEETWSVYTTSVLNAKDIYRADLSDVAGSYTITGANRQSGRLDISSSGTVKINGKKVMKISGAFVYQGQEFLELKVRPYRFGWTRYSLVLLLRKNTGDELVPMAFNPRDMANSKYSFRGVQERGLQLFEVDNSRDAQSFGNFAEQGFLQKGRMKVHKHFGLDESLRLSPPPPKFLQNRQIACHKHLMPRPPMR